MYYVVLNHCDCHPETCCCNPYKLVDLSGETIATFRNEDAALYLASKLNKEYL